MKRFLFSILFRPGFVPGLAPPKIPDGEKVDFDVSSSQDGSKLSPSNCLFGRLLDHVWAHILTFHCHFRTFIENEWKRT